MQQVAKRIYDYVINWAATQDPEELDGTPLEIALSGFECDDDFLIELESGEEITCCFDEVANVMLYHNTYNLDEDFTPEVIQSALEDAMYEISYDPESYCFNYSNN